jgi:hypothetical protein
MQYLFFLCFAIPSLCFGQDTITKNTAKKDHANRNFMLSINCGTSVPENNYGIPPRNFYNSSYSIEPYGFSFSGLHLDITGTYFPFSDFGFAARYGMDINTATSSSNQKGIQRNVVDQYLGGVCLSVSPKQNKFNLYFIGLIGVITAKVLNADNSFGYGSASGVLYQPTGGSVVLGFGNKLGTYFGMEFSSKIHKQFYFNLSVGYLYSSITFKNSITTTYYWGGSGPSVVTSNSVNTMSLGILQANGGLSYHF